MRNKTDIKKGGTVRLYCNVSGTPAPNVSWTHVQSGKKWNNKTVTIVNIQVENLGEYKCEASNIYGSDTKSTFIFYEGKCGMQLPVPKFKKGLGTSVHIVKITSYKKITQRPEISLKN